MKSFPITDIPEFSKKERIVVVGIIGKSPYRYPNKTSPLLSSADSEENGVQCYWDERSSVLYLHATTYLDTKQLTEFAATLNEESKSTQKDADGAHWLVAAGELSAESCKAIALVFHLSHIVVLSSPTSVFDLGYLQLFKAIDAFRAELQSATTDALTAAELPGAWASHGRACCPRLLFHFRRAPRALRDAHALKRAEHAIEDQLYFILRKARIITNICANSLFAIPKNEEFVYLSPAAADRSARDVSSLVRGLVSLCAAPAPTPAPAPAADRAGFKQFLQGHVDLAFAQGFDDNVGKYAMSTSFFELPSASSWRAAARAISPIYLQYSEDMEGGSLYESLATDVRFSEARCAKVLPIAQASYSEGLPSHYSSQHHAHKREESDSSIPRLWHLRHELARGANHLRYGTVLYPEMSIAISVLEQMARGPLSAAARDKLARACEATWRSRRLCEARSLTNHPCVRQEHDGTKDHSSGVRYVSACNCGRTKTSRDDPYSVRRANHTFYVEAAAECGVCDTLLNIDFPVFQPSTPTYRAAAVRPGSGPASSQSPPASPSPSSAPEGAWSGGGEALSPGEGEGRSAEAERDEEREGEVFDVVAVRHEQDKCIVRQPSTTEYLPGMLHTASPASLLPAHASWSLVCVGAASLYSHGAGLAEHLQPGLLPHANCLLPWDCAVSRTEQVAAWRAARAAARGGRGGGKPAPQPAHLTVKIFIGFEYECPRGHRFIFSPADGAGGGGGGGGPGARGSGGARCAGADLPLYMACACRGHKPMLAQCMRVHVVTPKAPLHVTLQPQVQPVAGGPIFIPQPEGEPPIKLSASAYWILRLPYIYSDERGPLPRPTTPQTSGRIVAPMFGLAD